MSSVGNQNGNTLLRQSNSTTDGCISSSKGDSTHDNSFCSLVHDKLGSRTPSQWWTAHFDNILDASQHSQDPNFIYRNWTRSLLASLSPELLQQGIRARPSVHAFQYVADILHKRIMDPQNSPPLKIAVLGGSVTRGHGCPDSPLILDDGQATTPQLDATLCAWPSRLESLINALAGMQLVQVFNLAVGATNLQFGTPLIKYGLYPKQLLPSGPDAILSAYSTNEQAHHVEDTTTAEWIKEERERVQEFITTCGMACRPCARPPPLVGFVHDYLGNRQEYVLREMSFDKVVTELAEWYMNVMHVSYANVIRRHIYADTTEIHFTPAWTDEITGEPKVAVHFGMGGHSAIAWSILYSMMDVISGYCDNKEFVEKMKSEGHEGVFSNAVVDLVNTVRPPALTHNLSLQNVSREWQENAERQSQCKKDNSVIGKIPCAFAFIAGPEATVQSPEELDDYLQPYLVANKGWESFRSFGEHGYVKKLGLVATGANASMTLKLTNVDTAVRIINVQHLKSYSDKWMGSQARFTVRIENPCNQIHTSHFDISGYHNYTTR